MSLQEEIVGCRKCPRLLQHCAEVAEIKRRAFREETYWGRPVPSFGDPRAKLLVVGLAPAAHGANRTGRVFTGDRSGDLLYRVLHATGFASQPESRRAGDGLELKGAWITCTAHCAPPDNKPLPIEIRNCREWLVRELELLKDVRVVVALGKIAFDAYRSAAKVGALAFGHHCIYETGVGRPVLISSYHPSQQNTSTGKLTEEMLQGVFEEARRVAGM